MRYTYKDIIGYPLYFSTIWERMPHAQRKALKNKCFPNDFALVLNIYNQNILKMTKQFSAVESWTFWTWFLSWNSTRFSYALKSWSHIYPSCFCLDFSPLFWITVLGCPFHFSIHTTSIAVPALCLELSWEPGTTMSHAFVLLFLEALSMFPLSCYWSGYLYVF